jgi:hypothetical protein
MQGRKQVKCPAEDILRGRGYVVEKGIFSCGLLIF